MRGVGLFLFIATTACAAGEPASGPDGGVVDRQSDKPFWVVYLADALTDGRMELFAVDVSRNKFRDPVRINGELVSGSVTTDPRWSPDGQELLYHAAQEVLFTHELYASNLEGKKPGPGIKMSPPQQSGDSLGGNGNAGNGYDWSPDGSRVRFYARFGDEPIGLYVVNTSEPGVAHKVNWRPAHADIDILNDSAWSPDSRTLLYLSRGGLYAVDVSGALPGPPVRVNPRLDPGEAIVPSEHGVAFWSPDGTKLLYRATLDDPQTVELYVTRFVGGVRRATRKVSGELVAGGNVTGGISSPFWSPDGRKVLYRADQEVDDHFELYVVDMTRPVPGTPHKVNHDLAASGGLWEAPAGFGGIAYSWSPDSTRVTYLALAPPNFVKSDLWVVDVSGKVPSRARRVRPGGIVSFQWSPDSAHLALTHRVDLELYLVDMTARLPGAPVRVGADLGLTVSPPVHWSPDSSRFAVRGVVGKTSPRSVWLTSMTAPSDAEDVGPPFGEGGGVRGERIEWSDDSTRLVFAAVAQVPGHHELYLVDLSSGIPQPAERISGPLIDGGDVSPNEFWLQPRSSIQNQ